MELVTRQKLVAFGTFEVDLDAGEIRKSGLRVRLSGQPFRLLAALLARPGETLSREILQHEIWGDNTNVDFERGIASAVNKLREALGDSAEHPRYIETLARRGYRFIAPVTVTFAAGRTAEPRPDPAMFQVAASALELSAAVAAPGALPSMAASTPPAYPLPESESQSVSASHGYAIRPPTWRDLRSSKGRLVWPLGLASLLVLLAATLVYVGRQPARVTEIPRIEQLTHSNTIYPGPPNPETFLSIATDGPRLYVPVLVDGRSQLSSLALDGPEPQAINMPEDLRSGAITAISRDGSRLLVRSLQTREPEQPLWIVPTTGLGVTRVGDILAHDATWMPNGDETVLYASGNELGLVHLGNGEVSTYAALPGRAFWLRWSPDGKVLRFTLLDPINHSSSLWELDAETRHIHPLAIPALKDLDLCCGAWIGPGTSGAPSSDRYVFQASDVHNSNLWMLGAGSHPRLTQLTNGPIRFTSPVPSREGRAVFAFGVEQPGGTRIFDRTLHQFVPTPHYLEGAQRISYSRDGVWVAWTDSQGRLWRARSEGGADLLRLGGNDLEVFHAHWSPDGKQLLLMARRPGETWQVFAMGANGGALHRLLNDRRNLADPDWSPDASQIVFGREADLMGKESGPDDIEISNLRTHQVRPLPGSTDLFSPRWSPDGQWIAALSRDQARLLVFHLKDGTWKTLFTRGAADPVWSADSRSIYFHAFAQPDSAILRVTLSGSVENVADLSKMGLPSADNYFFSGITPEGTPLIEPRVGTGNLYSVELPPL